MSPENGSPFSGEQEYKFVRDKWASYADSSFDDFKLYAAVGAVLGWQPLSDWLFPEQPQLVLAGFIALAAVTSIIMLREFLRQSATLFYLDRMLGLEEICGHLSWDGTAYPPATASAWMLWQQAKHAFIGRTYYLLFCAFVVLFPAAVLWFQGAETACTVPYSVIYVALSILFLIAPGLSYYKLYHTADSTQLSRWRNRARGHE